jgi:hypothetical protein
MGGSVISGEEGRKGVRDEGRKGVFKIVFPLLPSF